eukprot:c15248_g1_i1.p1 GENE.c15248_g1_i1~~c15248_g1_i1.p1  ORF type:complete len:237 (+),score=38.34 c15248_g1_i1:29-712(+)
MGDFNFFHEVNDHVSGTTLLSVLIVVGLFQVICGYRFFKASVFLVGFVAGFVVITSIASKYSDDAKTIYLSGVAVGVAAGCLCSFLVTVGRILLGLVCGVGVAYLAYLAFLHNVSETNTVMFYVAISVFGLLGGFLGYKAGRILIIIATSFGGSVLMFRSIDLLAHNKLSLGDVQHASLSTEGWCLFAGCIVVAIFGVVFQLRNPCFSHHRHHHHHHQGSHTSPLLG